MKKRFLAICMALTLALCLGLTVPAFAANTSGSCGASLRWSYNNGTLTIQGTGKMSDYVPAFAIDAPWIDYLEQIRTIDIANGVTSIGDYAFSGCANLTSVTIPGSVTAIGTGAFCDCESLTSVSIPSGVTTIGDVVFNCCTSLTDINVASGNPAYSSVDGVLFNADQTLLHTYPAGRSSASYSIPASVTKIGDDAFYICSGLTSMTIPSSVKSIGDSAFAWCASLTSVTILNGVTTIEDWAFLRCSSLTSVSIPNSVTAIGSNAFSCCENLTSVTIPNSVTTIGSKAFYECTSLSSITIPNSVKSFGMSVFQGCSSLTSVTIPSGVKSITMGLFSLCGSLTSVTIPDSVTAIGTMAFNRCDSLKDIYYGGSESQWGQIAITKSGNSLTNVAIHYNSAMPTAPTEPAPEPEAPATPTFTDVPVGEWYADAVAWAVEKEITAGTGNNRFSPGQNCTNAQILTFIWRAYGKPDPTIDDPFTNSIPEAYTRAAAWAYEKGMVSGTIFDANKPCTRAMAATYLWQAAGSPAAPAASFTDVSPNAAYAQAIAWAVEQKITTGTGTGSTFSPDDVCNRGQIVTFLYRAFASDTPKASKDVLEVDFSAEYMSSPYYKALQEVVLTGDYRKDMIAVASSQIGYNEGDKENQLDGSYHGDGDYTEYGRYLDSNGSAWCSEFASWCARVAKVPTSILNSSKSANIEKFGAPYYTWSQTVYAGGTYTPRPGDLALFAWSGTSLTAKSLSHTAIVYDVESSGNNVKITLIEGNTNDAVKMSTCTVEASTGELKKGHLVYFVAPEYES